jgi:glycosyltransferase involved in cell wall biosynthesis
VNIANKPRFSVVTCSYNQAQFIGETIESVVRQGHPSFEHIVVDGGSKDNSREVCARYHSVRFILAPGTTQSEALNIGFAEARGEIIAWLNSDDYYEPGAFAVVDRAIDPSRHRWIVAGAAKVVNQDGGYMWMLRNGRVPLARLLHHADIYPFTGWTVMPCQPSVFFHRRVLEDVGPLDGQLRRAMDYDFWLRMLVKGYTFHYIPRILSSYRYHATSHSNQGFDTFLDEWKRVAKRHRDALPKWRQLLVDLWWVYGRLESPIVGRHKAALQHIARGLHDHPEWRTRAGRLRLAAEASLRAPWLPIRFAWYALVGTTEQRLLARSQEPPGA